MKGCVNKRWSQDRCSYSWPADVLSLLLLLPTMWSCFSCSANIPLAAATNLLDAAAHRLCACESWLP
jgi:hypothetical protein